MDMEAQRPLAMWDEARGGKRRQWAKGQKSTLLGYHMPVNNSEASKDSKIKVEFQIIMEVYLSRWEDGHILLNNL